MAATTAKLILYIQIRLKKRIINTKTMEKRLKLIVHHPCKSDLETVFPRIKHRVRHGQLHPPPPPHPPLLTDNKQRIYIFCHIIIRGRTSQLVAAWLSNQYHSDASWLPWITLKQVWASYKNCLKGCDQIHFHIFHFTLIWKNEISLQYHKTNLTKAHLASTVES